MAMPWNLLRTDNFSGDPDAGYAGGYAPIGYTNPGGLQAAMQGGILCTWNNWTSAMVLPTVTANVGGGGRVRGQVDTLVGNLPGLGWGVETGGSITFSQFVATNDAGTTGYLCTGTYIAGSTQPSLRLSIRSLNGSRTIQQTIITPNLTAAFNLWVESGYADMPGGTQQWVFMKLYASDGVTLLGEINQLFWNDWASAPASLSSNLKFALSGQWASWDNVSYYDYAYVGALQTPEAFIFTASQSRTIVYVAPPQGGTGPYTYQWQKKVGAGAFANIGGATSAVLLDDIISGSYEYRCVVTDSLAASVTSNAVSVVTANMVTIIANGDSITEGLAGGIYASWGDTIQEEFRGNGKTLFLVNFGAGATTVSYQQSLYAQYLVWNNRVKPDVVTGRLGTNDAQAGLSNVALQASLELGVQKAAIDATPQVKTLYFCEPWSGTGLAPRNANNAGYDAVFTALAAANPSLVFWQGNGVRAASTVPPALASWFNEAAPNELHPTYLGNTSALTPADYAMIIANLTPISIISVSIDNTCPETVLPGGTINFAATVAGTGLYDNSVSWSTTGASTINPTTGVFTAAGSAETCTVTATSVADPTKTDTCTVQVGSPGPVVPLAGGFRLSVPPFASTVTGTLNGTFQLIITNESNRTGTITLSNITIPTETSTLVSMGQTFALPAQGQSSIITVNFSIAAFTYRRSTSFVTLKCQLSAQPDGQTVAASASLEIYDASSDLLSIFAGVGAGVGVSRQTQVSDRRYVCICTDANGDGGADVTNNGNVPILLLISTSQPTNVPAFGIPVYPGETLSVLGNEVGSSALWATCPQNLQGGAKYTPGIFDTGNLIARRRLDP